MPADASIFKEALRVAQSRGILPTSLSSAQLRELESAVRRRAVFSAKLEEARVLEVIKGNVELLASGQRDEFGRVRSKAETKAQVFEELKAAGVNPAPAGTPALQDFYSDARLELIASTQFQTTANYGRWLASQDETALDVNPAWELVRVVDPLTLPRDWGRRWTDAANEVGWQGVAGPGLTGGRLIALKNSPVWQALGDGAGGYEDTLGNPYPPFAFNSGMNVVDVGREEAEAFGLIRPEETIAPEQLDLNDGLEASVGDLTSADLPGLAKAGMEIVSGVLRLINRRVFENGEWREDEHPRTADGEFTDGAGGEAGSSEKSGDAEKYTAPSEKEFDDFFADALEGDRGRNRYITTGSVDADTANWIYEETKFNLRGYRHVLDGASTRHIIGRHGAEKEALRGQSPVTRDDLRRIPELVATADTVERGEKTKQGLHTIVFKKFEKDTTIVIEEIRAGRKSLVPKTMYKLRGGEKENGRRDNACARPFTSKTSPPLPKASHIRANIQAIFSALDAVRKEAA